jgi:sugar lactone lactonase YvrE
MTIRSRALQLTNLSKLRNFNHSFLLAACLCLPLTLSQFAHAANQFGSVSIGSPSAAKKFTLTVSTPGKLSTISVVTQGITGLDFAGATGGTCLVGHTYNVGNTCTVSVIMTPKSVGIRYGAVVLSDVSGNLLATTLLQGTGNGPQAVFLPGVESQIPTSGVDGPGSACVDPSGNVFIADTNNNRILKETLSGGSYTETVVPTSAMNNPYTVELDGAGNLYITDAGNNRVLKETLAAGSYTESIVSTSALNYPVDAVVDGSGNIYIADLGNNRIVMETLGAGETEIPTTNPLVGPGGVAVDSVGNVYIADTYNNQVLKETLAAGVYTESVVPTSSLNMPGAVRVDASSNIFIADTFNQRVIKERPAAGSYIESAVTTSALNFPYGLAIDPGGDIYVTDTFNNRVIKEDIADPPSLSFAPTVEGSTSTDSPRIVTVYNYGDSATKLTFTAVTFPADFPESVPAPKDCTSTSALGPNAHCALTINFTPVALMSGSTPVVLTEGVTITTNTLNTLATLQTVSVTGTEIHP